MVLLFDMSIFKLHFFDLVDIVAVAFILKWVYNLLRGSLALRILAGVAVLYVAWLIVRTLHMDLLTLLLNQFISLGVIILAIVFQPELRRFLVVLGNQTLTGQFATLFKARTSAKNYTAEIQEIVSAMLESSQAQTGMLIVVTKDTNLEQYVETGIILNCAIQQTILRSIFLRDSPLHDGAVIIDEKIIRAAKCILPVSASLHLPTEAGLRHRAALGISEATSALALMVSEETGKIGYAHKGELVTDIDLALLKKKLGEFLNS